MVCIRWSNMVVVVNCDSNFISTMVIFQFLIIRNTFYLLLHFLH
jgi:hypothetical protein